MTGAGTSDDPFRIDNVTIVAKEGIAFIIHDETSRYHISNVTLISGSMGVGASFRTNAVTIENLWVRMTNASGGDGILLIGRGARISKTIISAPGVGIQVVGDDNHLHRVTVKNFTTAGIRISGDNISLSELDLTGARTSFDGILSPDRGSKGVEIRDSIVRTFGTCMTLGGSGARVYRNSLEACSTSLKLLQSSQRIQIYSNAVYHGDPEDYGLQNSWNLSSSGNYWHGFQGGGSRNGITWDTPKQAPPHGTDFFPLLAPP